jgi:hypothetical protein
MELAEWLLALAGIRRLDERVFGRRLALCLLGVPRTDYGRVEELVHALCRYKQFRILELDRDGVARKHVGDIHREDIGAALLQKRRALAFALRGLELRLCLLAFLDSGDDTHVAHRHGHPIDRRPRRGRKDVARMNGPRPAILVHLADGYVRDHSGNGDVDSRVFQRQTIDGGICAFDQEVGGEGLIGRRSMLLRRDVSWHEEDTGKNSDQDARRSESHAAR